MTISSAAGITFSIDEVPAQALPGHVLMVKPDHYQVEYVINPHMEGHIGGVDKARALSQWTNVRDSFASLGFDVIEIDGAPDCPDMVFSANQTLPGLDADGNRVVVLSNMATAARGLEVMHFGSFFADRGYEIEEIDSEFRLEGCGDAIWHHDLRLLWCGHGFRSDPESYEHVCSLFGVPGILLELRDEEFYHLDTCLSILGRDVALWVPSAFTRESAEMIERLVPRLIEVPYGEASGRLACNAYTPDGRTVLVQAGADETTRSLRDLGFEVREVETDEFLKAGGSVFCIKQMYW